MSAQINTWPLPAGSVNNTAICGFSGYNATHTFRTDNQNQKYTSPATATTCVLAAYKLVSGVPTQLTVSNFTVYPYIVSSGQSVCTTPNPANPTYERVFSAPANTTYWFPIYIIGADGSTYQLNATFQ